MDHYFNKNVDVNSDEKDIYFNINEKTFHLRTDNGVFSKSGLDFGSRLLIESVINISSERVLDLGCGYGPIGISYKFFNPDSEVSFIDVNERAIGLARKNLKINNLEGILINNDILEYKNNTYTLILSNPPIRAGKALLQKIIAKSNELLVENGLAIFVIHKNLGAASAIKFSDKIYKKTEVINKKSGYYIIKCIK